MAVPDFQSIMLPLLRLAGERKGELSVGEAYQVLGDRLGLTDEALRETLPSGIQGAFANRVGWAASYLKKAGLLESSRRGFFRITPRGDELLGRKLGAINIIVRFFTRKKY